MKQANVITAGLRADGFRFVRRGLRFLWVHPLEKQADDFDTTDMTDTEFDAFVMDVEGVAA